MSLNGGDALRVALPNKGRLADPALQLLRDAGSDALVIAKIGVAVPERLRPLVLEPATRAAADLASGRRAARAGRCQRSNS